MLAMVETVWLQTIYVLFFIKIGSREVHIAGVTQHPNESWMKQVARNVTMEEWGFLSGQQYLIFDRDSKFCSSFRRLIRLAGIKPIRLPPMSPNLNAYAERYVRSAREECLSQLVLFGEECAALPIGGATGAVQGRRHRVQATPRRDAEVLLPGRGVVHHG